jgi:hypothetical protein
MDLPIPDTGPLNELAIAASNYIDLNYWSRYAVLEG